MYVGDKSQKKSEEVNITKVRRVGRDVIRNGHKGGLMRGGGTVLFLSVGKRTQVFVLLLKVNTYFHALFWVFITFYSNKIIFLKE